MKGTKYLAAAACACALLQPLAAHAQWNDQWRFNALIYVYLPDIGGTSTFPPNGASESATVDSSKILENLKFAFMGTFDASKGRWGISNDLMYLDVGGDKSGTRDISIGGGGIPAGASANVNLDVKGLIWTVAGTYEAVATPDARLQVLAGARLLSVKQNLGWEVTGNIGSIPLAGRQGSNEAKVDNWDAVVGLRGRVMFGSDRAWFVPYYVDVGTGDSDLTWQAIGGIGYAFKWGDVIAAWRYLDYNLKSSDKIQSINFNGPAIGVAFHW